MATPVEELLIKQLDEASRCLESYGEEPSKVKETLGAMTALMKAPANMLRGEQDMRNARDSFASEHLEIATYRLIEHLAQATDHKQALQVARENIAGEERMAAHIEKAWARTVARSLGRAATSVASGKLLQLRGRWPVVRQLRQGDPLGFGGEPSSDCGVYRDGGANAGCTAAIASPTRSSRSYSRSGMPPTAASTSCGASRCRWA